LLFVNWESAVGSDHAAERPSARLAIASLVLLGIGFASSLYLTNLYVEVTEAMQGTSLDSFCNISEGVNCESVAASEYSSFLGVPISVYGLQYFGAAIVLVLASYFRLIPVRRWDSLLFAFGCVGVPVTIILGWISVSLITSVCIMCVTVYTVNTLLVLLLGIPNRKRLGDFAKEGVSELASFALDAKHRAASVVVTLVVLSQFFWVPRIMGREAHAANASDPPPAATNANVGSWMGLPASRNTLGPVNAPIRIEEFTDFQCPFCGRAHDVMLEVVRKHPGKIHLVHRDFPLDHHCNPGIERRFHPDACKAAYFARCASNQDLFWPYEAMLFHHQRQLKKAPMLSFAKQVGLDEEKMKACVALETTREAVLADIKEGIERGISGTPTFFVNGEAIVGARPMEFWEQKLQSLLGEDATETSSSSSTPSMPTAEPGPSPSPAAASDSAL